MSDTTTITPEERAEWLKDAQPKSVSHYEPIDFEMDKRIRRLLTALEAAEAESARLRAERDWLAERCAELCDEDEHYGFLGHDESVKLWKRKAEEAARRAVADAESEVEG